ncbi:MAG: molybdopterin molybdenumtransferase MoeA [Candidatus Tectimicrobiota bacterium]|nr:MAG: molybdopterin molybdenumtransferase MoeA [Candidatus Tectomicrobia bacterium]
MLSYPQALARIVAALEPLASESVPVLAAAGRVLAADLVAPHDMPPFRQAMMDGYAVRASETRQATPQHPVRLAIGPTLTAGMAPPRLLPRQAIRIMTGAPLPAAATAVVRLEEAERDGEQLVLRQPVPAGQHVQRRGAEVRRGTVLLRAGARLTPPRLGLALALGITTVCVRQQPQVALVAPGDELLPPGAPWQPGKKWCSNLYAQELRACELGCRTVNLGLVPDTLPALVAQLERGLEADLLVVLGGSGGGDRDFTARAFQAIGAQPLCRGVATSPGRSLLVARAQKTLLFALPGSPWAAYIGFEVFVRPAIRTLLGQHPALPPLRLATLTAAQQGRRGLTHFRPVRLHQGTNGWLATPLPSLLALARTCPAALGLLVLPPTRTRLPAGARARILPITD